MDQFFVKGELREKRKLAKYFVKTGGEKKKLLSKIVYELGTYALKCFHKCAKIFPKNVTHYI